MEEELNIRDLFMAIWRKRILIVIITLVFFVIGVIFYGLINNDKKVVKSEEKLSDSEIVNKDTNNEESDEENLLEEIDNKKYIGTNFVFARGLDKVVDGVTNTYRLNIDAGVINNLNIFSKSKNFLEGVLREIGSSSDIEDLQNNVNIMGNGSGDILTLIVASENKDEAVIITNKIIENLTERINQLYQISEIRIIDGPRELEEEKIEEIKEKINGKTTVVEEKKENDKKEDTSLVKKEEETSSPIKKIILITIVGFVLSCGVVVCIEIFNNSVKSSENLEKATNSKVLVEIPKTNCNLVDKFELLRVKLNGTKIALITSAECKDGKTFVAENLSKSYARFGNNVLLTDAEKLISGKDLYDDVVPAIEKNLTINLSDENNSDEHIKVDDLKIKERLSKLENSYDIIIIDSKNILESANTLAVSKIVKNTIIVSCERKTKLENIVRAQNNVKDIGGNIIGHVLVDTEKK